MIAIVHANATDFDVEVRPSLPTTSSCIGETSRVATWAGFTRLASAVGTIAPLNSVTGVTVVLPLESVVVLLYVVLGAVTIWRVRRHKSVNKSRGTATTTAATASAQPASVQSAG